MLTQILAELAAHPSGLELRVLSRRLGVQPSALEGMLALLVRKGRLRLVAPTACAACAAAGECNLLASQGPRYLLAEGAAPSPCAAIPLLLNQP